MREAKHMCVREAKHMKGKAHTKGTLCQRGNMHMRKTTCMKDRNAHEGEAACKRGKVHARRGST